MRLFLRNVIYRYIDKRLENEYTPAGDYIRIAVGAFLFIFFLFLQSSGISIHNAVIAQLQVMISIYLTVSVPHKGYLAAIAVNIIEIIVVANVVFVLGLMTALPGFIIPFFTIITISIIYIIGRRLLQKHFEIIKQRDELSAAKKVAESSTHAKSDFLSSMSHEIRTPMNSILGYLEMMPQENLNSEQKEYLSIVLSNAKDLVSILNDILDVSKVEHGKMILDSVSFNPAEKIGLVLKLLELKAREKNISLIFNQEKTPACLGDPLRLGQIITNLVGNSIKFTPANGRIDVTLYSKYEGNFIQCNIEVRDTGIGISQDEQSRIFESFTQGSPAIMKNFGGTGLGLTISANLVAMMGGKLSVESSPGKGSKFYFSIKLPVAPAVEKNDKKDICLELFSDKKYKALVAEDAPDSMTLIQLMLKKLCLSSDSAVNGKEALEKFKKGSYDVILLDGNMPEMSGTETAIAIRNFETENNLQRTPIIALSAKVFASEKDEFIEAGADIFLEKPVFLNNLSDVLHLIFSKKTSEKKSGTETPASENIISKMSDKIGISENALLRIITEFYKVSLPEYLRNISEAVQSADMIGLENSAHRLKGAAASLMFEDLSSECASLENFARKKMVFEATISARRVFTIAAQSEGLIKE